MDLKEEQIVFHSLCQDSQKGKISFKRWLIYYDYLMSLALTNLLNDLSLQYVKILMELQPDCNNEEETKTLKEAYKGLSEILNFYSFKEKPKKR
jgi:hypothetical protein